MKYATATKLNQELESKCSELFKEEKQVEEERIKRILEVFESQSQFKDNNEWKLLEGKIIVAMAGKGKLTPTELKFRNRSTFRDVSSTYLKMVMNELVRFGMLNRTEERKRMFLRDYI